MPGVLSGGLCKAPAQWLRGRAMCVFLQPDHSIPHLEPFLAASLPHSSCSSSSRLGTYSLQIRRASLHMPASCKHDGRNAHRFTRTPALLAPRNTSGLLCHLAENQLEETTTAAPANSSLPRWHLCPSIHLRRLSGECPSIPAASVERALTASKCTRSRCPEDHPCPGRTPRALRELRCAAKALPVQCSKSRPQLKSARNHLNKWFLFGS